MFRAPNSLTMWEAFHVESSVSGRDRFSPVCVTVSGSFGPFTFLHVHVDQPLCYLHGTCAVFLFVVRSCGFIYS